MRRLITVAVLIVLLFVGTMALKRYPKVPRPITDAEMSEAVAENARRIAAMGGRYGEPAHD